MLHLWAMLPLPWVVLVVIVAVLLRVPVRVPVRVQVRAAPLLPVVLRRRTVQSSLENCLFREFWRTYSAVKERHWITRIRRVLTSLLTQRLNVPSTF